MLVAEVRLGQALVATLAQELLVGGLKLRDLSVQLARTRSRLALQDVDAPRAVLEPLLAVRALPLQSVNGNLQLADGLSECVVRLGASRFWRQASTRMGRAAARARSTVARSSSVLRCQRRRVWWWRSAGEGTERRAARWRWRRGRR